MFEKPTSAPKTSNAQNKDGKAIYMAKRMKAEFDLSDDELDSDPDLN